MILSNSSPLMYLAKIGKLSLLKNLFKEIIIPREVYEEVVEGKDEFFDSLIIKNSVRDGWIKIKEIKIEKHTHKSKISGATESIKDSVGIEKVTSGLHLGEIALINLARKLKPDLILLDDASARTIAESFGFNVKGTLHVLLKAYKKKMINKQETKSLINQLIFSGFRISQELYIGLLSYLE